MATIRKRGNSWHAQVRRTGFSNLTRSFQSKDEAVRWSRDRESEIDQGTSSPFAELKGLTVEAVLERYEAEITVKKRGADRERFKIRVLKRHALSALTLDRLNGRVVAAYRDDRLRQVSSGTVRRELAILRHCFSICRKEWGIPLQANPVDAIVLPRPSEPRSRRVEVADQNAFWIAVEAARAPWIKPLVVLAIETGMRRGELLGLRWIDIDFQECLATLAMTKNGYGRRVPLTPLALATLSRMDRSDERLFPIKAFTARQGWERVVKRSGIADLRFHDLRHEAVSRFFELGLSAPEVALISGHKDMRMLARYTHLRPETVAKKIALLSGGSTADE